MPRTLGARDKNPGKRKLYRRSYCKEFNPRRANGRRPGSLDKNERDSYPYWYSNYRNRFLAQYPDQKDEAIAFLRTPEEQLKAKIAFLEWEKLCVLGVRSRKYRSKMSIPALAVATCVGVGNVEHFPRCVVLVDYGAFRFLYLEPHYASYEEAWSIVRETNRKREKALRNVNRKLGIANQALAELQNKLFLENFAKNNLYEI